jgi:hypothetical protein
VTFFGVTSECYGQVVILLARIPAARAPARIFAIPHIDLFTLIAGNGVADVGIEEQEWGLKPGS